MNNIRSYLRLAKAFFVISSVFAFSIPIVKAAPADMMRITEIPATQPNGHSGFPVMTADGRFVVFSSASNTMVEGDANHQSDVFIYDHNDDSIELVSVSSSEVQGNANSGGGDIEQFSDVSSDGRFVVFASGASNLVAGDTNSSTDIFVRDRNLGTTERVNVSSSGQQADDFYSNNSASISDDGRYVAFVSDAPNLVAGDTNGGFDVFVRDRLLSTTVRVSVQSDGDEVGYATFNSAAISDNGQYVVFESNSDQLVPEVSNNIGHVFRHNMGNGVTELVSKNVSNVVGNNNSNSVSVSADGNLVAFISTATNLIASDTNGLSDVFIKNMTDGSVDIASVTSSGAQNTSPGTSVTAAFISADGAYISFVTDSDTLASGDSNYIADVLVHHNVPLGSTVLMSISASGTQADWPGVERISKPANSGNAIAFSTQADDILGDTIDTNGKYDVFYHTYNPSGPTHANYRIWNADPSYTPYEGADGDTLQLAMSDDGRYIVFTTNATNLTSVTDPNGESDVYWYDKQTQEIKLISAKFGSTTETGNRGSSEPSVSNDGKYVVFQSTSSDLTGNPDNATSDVYIRNVQNNTTTRISELGDGSSSDGISVYPEISGDGQFIAFSSSSTDLVAGDINGQDDIFIYDVGLDALQLVSVATGGAQSNGYSERPAVSTDGRYVAFMSYATNLDGASGSAEAFVRDRTAGTTTWVSKNSSGVSAGGISNSYRMSISGDGKYVVFDTDNPLVVSDDNYNSDVYRIDWQLGSAGIKLASVDEDGNTIAGFSQHGSISANGNFVAFDSDSDDVVTGDSNSKTDVFVRNMTTDEIKRASLTPDDEQVALSSTDPKVSADGTKAIFIRHVPSGGGTLFRGAVFGDFTDTNPLYNDLYFVSFAGGPVASIPSVSSASASGVSTTSATLNGNITDAGSPTPTVRGFEYGLTVSYGQTVSENGSFSTGVFGLPVSSLTCNTVYHFRAFAQNTTGTGNGSDMTFTTSACAVTPPGGQAPTTGTQASETVNGGYVGVHPNGTLLLDGQTIYLVKDRQRYGFRDAEEYRSYGYNFAQTVQANLFDRARLPLAQSILKAMPGSLVLDKSDGRTVYMIGVDNTKRGFASEKIFTELGFNYTKLFSVDLSGYATGAVINSSKQMHPEGSLVRESNSTVWWLLNGQRSGFESEQVFDTYGFSPSRLVKVNTQDLSVSIGPLMKLRDGTLVQDHGLYYIISDGTKMQFVSSQHLELWGYKLSNVINSDISRYQVGVFPR